MILRSNELTNKKHNGFVFEFFSFLMYAQELKQQVHNNIFVFSKKKNIHFVPKKVGVSYGCSLLTTNYTYQSTWVLVRP